MIHLPFPVSVNAMYANNDSKKGRGRYKTPAYKAWIKLAGQTLQTQRIKRCTGNFSLHIAASNKQRKYKRDISNHIKAIEDLLVAHNITDDDHMVDGIAIFWDDIEHDIELKIFPTSQNQDGGDI